MSDHHKPIDYFRSIIFILITFAIALAASDNTTYLGIPIIFLIMGSSFLIHWLIFIPSFIYRTEKYYDLTGMISYLFAIIIALVLINQTYLSISLRSYIVALMVCLWTLRLGVFLFQRIKVEKEDKRFKNIKNSFSGFLFAWTISAAWVCITASNAFTMIINNSFLKNDLFLFIGVFLWIFGFLFEIISDEQKRRFKLNKNNKGKFINVGLWSISRHPNYFGEIILWLGISIVSFPTLNGWQLITLISPIFVYLLLTKVSGINHLEKRSDEQWGEDPEYQKYKENTPVLLPFYGSK